MTSSTGFLEMLHNFSRKLEATKANRIAEDEELSSAVEVEKRQLREEKVEQASYLFAESTLDRATTAFSNTNRKMSGAAHKLTRLSDLVAKDHADLDNVDFEMDEKEAEICSNYHAMKVESKLAREFEDVKMKIKIWSFVRENKAAASKLSKSQIHGLGESMNEFFFENKVTEQSSLIMNGLKGLEQLAVNSQGLLTPDNTPPSKHNDKYTHLQPSSPTPAPRNSKSTATRLKVPKEAIGLGVTFGEKSIWSVPSSEDDEPTPKRAKLGDPIAFDLVAQDPPSSFFIRSLAPSPTSPRSPCLQLLEVSSAETSPEPEEEYITYASSSGDEYEAPVSKRKRRSSTDVAPSISPSTKLKMGDLVDKPKMALPYSRHGVTYEVWSRRQYAGGKLLRFSVNVIHVRDENGEVSVWNDEKSRRSFYLVRDFDCNVFAPRIGHKCQIKTHPEFVFGADEILGVQYNPKDALVCVTKTSGVVPRSAYPDIIIVFGSREDMFNFLAVLRVRFDTSLELRKKQIFENASLRLPKKWLA
ncbi:hypothetical protein JHW43_007611 [Diplocarpon mali]|nr:hypothetical protein JHW43_007611 [Diplocarpon mali]